MRQNIYMYATSVRAVIPFLITDIPLYDLSIGFFKGYGPLLNSGKFVCFIPCKIKRLKCFLVTIIKTTPLISTVHANTLANTYTLPSSFDYNGI